MSAVATDTFGWDIGGAHVKACRLRDGRVRDVAQWPCPLWLGLRHLADTLGLARQRWPGLDQARHAATMTGELADLFEHRQDGVQRIAGLLAETLGNAGALHFFAGDAGWCSAAEVGTHWAAVASANWLACARHAAQALPGDEGVLIDIGSTTTDLIAFDRGRVLTGARSDAQRLASGELVYQGVVRTPLCALARRVPWQGQPLNVMNELFATTADLYRLTGGLASEHDQHPSADGGSKTLAASRQRLARMIGLDARDAGEADWLALAAAWRSEQVVELQGQLARVRALHGLGPEALLVTAGCGDFLVPEIAGPLARRLRYADAVACLASDALPQTAAWVQVCAPSVAVAALLDLDAPRGPAPARRITEHAR